MAHEYEARHVATRLQVKHDEEHILSSWHRTSCFKSTVTRMWCMLTIGDSVAGQGVVRDCFESPEDCFVSPEAKC